MKLAYWRYLGPAHVGTLRIASSFKRVQAIRHAPLGDDYFNVRRSRLERERDFTPVTTSIVDRHVLAKGSQERVVGTRTRVAKQDQPDLLLLTPTCTSSILQEDLQKFVERAQEQNGVPTLLADVNHYRRNELQAADRTLEQRVRFGLQNSSLRKIVRTKHPSVNLIGFVSLGFHQQHDLRERCRRLQAVGIEVHQVLPEGRSRPELPRRLEAWVNVVPYREIGRRTANYLEKDFQRPFLSRTPRGVLGTNQWLRALAELRQSFFPSLPQTVKKYIQQQTQRVCQAAWFSRSIDCQNLTGKRAFVFGDASHAAKRTQRLSLERGIRVVASGTYCTHDADWFREQVQGLTDEVLITKDHTVVAERIQRLEPAAIFGTQRERHIGKRKQIPCGVISAPVHIQNFPLGFRPFLGYEGASQLCDLVYNSFALGREDHLLEIFGGHDTKTTPSLDSKQGSLSERKEEEKTRLWTADAQEELQRIPGFVRAKIQRKTEEYAKTKGRQEISLELRYQAKERSS